MNSRVLFWRVVAALSFAPSYFKLVMANLNFWPDLLLWGLLTAIFGAVWYGIEWLDTWMTS